ncbi:hypothetical protein [Nocardioides sp. Soil774]|uniref:hypothetical protein n=1 Tax=Nocardioides sp. Soil774 TaxID=1736408 RepID=UPI000A3FC658|nr:hypothetical protein [Nocardioides sp. Soil774]
MRELPKRPSLEHLRKQAKRRRRTRGVGLVTAQRELAAEYGFASWPRLVRHVLSIGLSGMERALALAEPAAVRSLLVENPSAATTRIHDTPPLLRLLADSTGAPGDIRSCAELLLDAGADPLATTPSTDGEWELTTCYYAVERQDVSLLQLLLQRGAEPDDDAFYHACERGGSAFLELLYRPGYENMLAHKLDFEDEVGLAWFLTRDPDLDALGALHWAIGPGPQHTHPADAARCRS